MALTSEFIKVPASADYSCGQMQVAETSHCTKVVRLQRGRELPKRRRNEDPVWHDEVA